LKLLTKEIEKKLPDLYSQEAKKPEEVKVIAKFFDPMGSWTWYATEYNKEQGLFFGFVRGMDNELGYFSLLDLESVGKNRILGIERDLHFGFNHTLAEVMQEVL